MSFSGGVKLSGPGMKPRFLKKKQAVVVAQPRRSNLRKRVRNIDKKVKRIQSREELSWVDRNFSGQVIDNTTAALFLLNGVTQGDDADNRDKREIQATSIQFKLNFSTDTDAISATFLRMIIFWDQQANGAAPSVTGAAGLLDTSVIGSELTAPYNRDTQKRYKIVYDRRWVMNPNVPFVVTPATGTTASVLQVGKMKQGKRKLSRIVKFNTGNAGTVADIASNSLYVFLISNLAAASAPTVTGGFRFYFKDE